MVNRKEVLKYHWLWMFLQRSELVYLLVLDTAVIIVALLCQHWITLVVQRITGPESMGWEHKAIVWVLRFGLVGTTVSMTFFDLGTRIVGSWRDFRRALRKV